MSLWFSRIRTDLVRRFGMARVEAGWFVALGGTVTEEAELAGRFTSLLNLFHLDDIEGSNALTAVSP